MIVPHSSAASAHVANISPLRRHSTTSALASANTFECRVKVVVYCRKPAGTDVADDSSQTSSTSVHKAAEVVPRSTSIISAMSMSSTPPSLLEANSLSEIATLGMLDIDTREMLCVIRRAIDRSLDGAPASYVFLKDDGEVVETRLEKMRSVAFLSTSTNNREHAGLNPRQTLNILTTSDSDLVNRAINEYSCIALRKPKG